MDKKNNKKRKLIIASVVITAVVVFTLTPIIAMLIAMSTHHEPYITAESYSEFKGLFDQKEVFLFPDALLERSTYLHGRASLRGDEIAGYEFTVTDIKESDFSHISVSGYDTEYTWNSDSKPALSDVISIDTVKITEEFYKNPDTNDVMLYEFILGDVKYSISGRMLSNYDGGLPQDIYPGNQELLSIAKMLIAHQM